MKLKMVAVPIAFLLMVFSCNAQNGPTQPSVALSWVQSANSTNAIAKNCVYRGLATKVYAVPALFCSAVPVTSYTDTTVIRGTQYFYAVTAQDVKGAESAYSLELAVVSPTINAPTGLASAVVSLLLPKALHPAFIDVSTADGAVSARVR